MATFVQEIDFAAPTALNTDTVGTDPLVNKSDFTIQAPNAIQDIRHIGGDPAATITYTLFVRRLDQSKRAIGSTPDFQTAKQGVAPQFPFPLNKGFFQWVEWQIAGALTAQKYTIKYIAPLQT
jgi:hypothetical protein